MICTNHGRFPIRTQSGSAEKSRSSCSLIYKAGICSFASNRYFLTSSPKVITYMKTKFIALSLLAVSLTVSRSFADTLHVSEPEAEKAIIQRVQPVYPPIAKISNLFGQVVVDMT